MGLCSAPRTQAPSHNSCTGHTRAQVAPSKLDSRMVRAEPRKFSVAIFLMNFGMSMCVGQACVQGALAHQTSCRFDSGFVACQRRQKFAERIRTLRSSLNIRQRILLIANRAIRCTARDEERLEAKATSFKRHSVGRTYLNAETCFCINRKYNPPETTNPTNHA